LILAACASGGDVASVPRDTGSSDAAKDGAAKDGADNSDSMVPASLLARDASMSRPPDSGPEPPMTEVDPCPDCGTEVCDVDACEDGLWCTEDVCARDGCMAEQSSDTCLIASDCHASGASSPSDPCLSCNPGTSTDRWTPSVGALCDDYDDCTTMDHCGDDGVCSGSPLIIGGEPNQRIEHATYLGTIADHDAFPMRPNSANLHPAEDVDWYSYGVLDTVAGRLFPRVELTPAASGVQSLCAYWVCESSTLDVDCREGTASTHAGLLGCCAEPWWGAVELDPDCGGLDDSGFVVVEVKQVGGESTCEPYELRWGDN